MIKSRGVLWPVIVEYVYSAGGLMLAIDVADIEVLGELVHIDTMQRLTYDQALAYRGDVLHILEPSPWPPVEPSPVGRGQGEGAGEGVSIGTETDL